ncbi:hypothetical protein SNOG_16000 [Parastagonospora nodorum SN15]|uniref:Reverse transcriptase domain-containing protein n=1 Tax=Phaeosphaeria nodorum (strain SN15 / ATCC MYA-4574 / FGSC 10173) TaxID=321614 RepID=Q0TWS8_PHANO|nr:hypothetical protein SNOG_16000 [Parastagonospora nodorum SN15]EAT76579.2 hypothetical protein SNOG_16000 [Parastagonospora nodorum SN15]
MSSREDLVPLEKVAFCIHKTLKNYTIIQAQGKNRGLLVTLFLTTEHGNIAIHNLYNYERAADIDELIEACRDKTYAHIIIGDFNLRHKDWEGPTCRNPHPEANTLVQKAGAIGMTCVNKPGHFTYSRGEFKTPGNEYKSVIDLAFVSTLLVGHASHDVLDGVFDSDHRPIRVTLDLRVERRRNYRYLWSEVTNETFADLVEKLAADMDWTAPESESAALQMLQDFIIRVLDPAVRDLVPRELLNQPLPVNHRTWTSVGVRIKNSRSRIVKLMSGRRGVWSVVKRAACWSRPKRIAQTPAFEHRGRIYTSDSDKNSEERTCPTVISVTSDRSFPLFVRVTAICNNTSILDWRITMYEPSHVALDKLEKDELKRILKDLPDGKAYGTDNIPYEALKKCRKVIEPILETIFNAFLQFRLHPDHFKETITFVIQKPGKDAKVPTSYRPIAILNTIGKVYERIIANRLKTLAQTHNLLPATQFGAPGRNTTLALEHLLNGVYRGWLCKSKVSLLSLDLSGAYDHVDREQLLDTLISKGIPDWLVRIVWSFLSNRRSFIHMPGFEGDEYWIDVGIPQGSPLSPLLFLFYSAPILAKFGKEYGPETVAMFSYVDDTYVLVGTASYGRNCKIMSEIHAKLYEWARQRNLRFSPAKYKVMHFVNKNERDWKQHMNCSDLPSVPGFSNMTGAQKKKVLPSELVVLGVTLDKCLTWVAVGAAFEKKWEDIKKRKMMIKEYYDEIVHYVASLQWRKFRQRRNSHEKFKHPAYEAAWMDHSLRFYNGLTRAQSSILIMMRTGNIALYGNPIHRMVKGSKDSMCRQCGMHLETSEHLLCHCKKLHMERQALTTAAGHNNFHLFMTTDCDLASAWAIRYFGLEQFKHVKDDKRYQFPLKRSNRLR